MTQRTTLAQHLSHVSHRTSRDFSASPAAVLACHLSLAFPDGALKTPVGAAGPEIAFASPDDFEAAHHHRRSSVH